MSKNELPRYLYKYEKINMLSIQNLKNAQLYFNAPKNFNDPFDCSTLQNINLTDEKLFEINKLYLSIYPEIASSKSILEIPDTIKNSIINSIQQEFKEYQFKLLNERGCTCFSEINNNLLMWSHYSDGHKGFCLEFDTSHKPFNKAMKVEYKKDFPYVDPMVYLKQEKNLNVFFEPILTKHQDWEYEQEWRIFHKEANKLFGYSVGSLNAVYFGCNVDPVNIEIIALILQGQNEDVKFYQAKKSKNNYSLVFENFQYIPHKNLKV